MARPRVSTIEKQMLTDAIVVKFDRELLEFIDAEVVKLRKAHIEAAKGKPHTQEQLAHAMSLCKTHDVKVANEYLRKMQIENNPPMGMPPTRTSFIRTLVQLGRSHYAA